MRKIPLILGLVLLAILTAWETRDFFIAHDGIGYFTSQPKRLLYIVSIGVVGGLLALAFSRLNPVARRTLRLIALGAFGICVTAFLVVLAARLVLSPSMVTESGAWGWIIATIVSLSLIAGLVWLEFYNVCRKTRP